MKKCAARKLMSHVGIYYTYNTYKTQCSHMNPRSSLSYSNNILLQNEHNIIIHNFTLFLTEDLTR